MRITKNTSGYCTRAIKAVFTKVHAFMRSPKCEGKPAPNWRNLRVQIEGRDGGYHSGRAYYGGHGIDWDVFLTLPRPTLKGTNWHTERRKGEATNYRVRKLASLIYHELMHTYGYKHSQYNDIRAEDLERLFPDNYLVPVPEPKPERVKQAAHIDKYARLVARRKAWESKARRAENALKKINKSIRYYERTYDDLGS